MFETLKNAFKIKEIREKILWTLFFLLLYRIGCNIPVPGVGTGLFSGGMENSTYLNIMSMMSGGSLSRGTWFAMGIGPYINASIIIQLLTVAIPALERLSKLGEEGQKKISAYTRIGALILAIVQSIGIIVSNGSLLTADDNASGAAFLNALAGQQWLGYILLVVIYSSGTLATVFIGERITEKGVSNGISLLIFIGILATAGISFIEMIGTSFFGGGDLNAFWKLVAYIVAIVLVFGLIVFVELSERKIPVQYAKMIKGRKQYGGQSTVIPIKVNSNGVMPLIFAFSLLSFPELIITMFWSQTEFAGWWQTYMGSDSILYMIFLVVLIFAFAFFYSSIQFNPDDISKTIQQNGGFIPGYRPGKPTAIYLKQIQTRITLFGALFLAFVALVPAVLFKIIDPGTPAVFSATGMLIAVSVALEFNNALESQIMMKNYKGFLK